MLPSCVNCLLFIVVRGCTQSYASTNHHILETGSFIILGFIQLLTKRVHRLSQKCNVHRAHWTRAGSLDWLKIKAKNNRPPKNNWLIRFSRPKRIRSNQKENSKFTIVNCMIRHYRTRRNDQGHKN